MSSTCFVFLICLLIQKYLLGMTVSYNELLERPAATESTQTDSSENAPRVEEISEEEYKKSKSAEQKKKKAEQEESKPKAEPADLSGID
jgi:hypothetical protein